MTYENLKFPSETLFLVTGAAGFIGSNLVDAILNMGYKVRGLDNLSNGSMDNIEQCLSNLDFEFIKGDITDITISMECCKNVDYVLHQAAVGSVPRSLKHPLLYVENNIKGTSNMMEASRLNGIKRFIYASSSSVYGDSSILPKREGEEGNVISPYALTKKVNEDYGKLYTEVFGLECVGLRYFNVFGPKQSPDSQYAAVIPKFINSVKHNKNVEIYGDGFQSRDFTYIYNVIEANLKACLAPTEASGEVYNVAVGGKYTINQIFEKIVAKIESKSVRLYSSTREGDVLHSQADIGKIKELLGYCGEIDFDEGLKRTIDWYENEGTRR